MPEPTTVWLARPGSEQGTEGTLTIEGSSVVFTREDGRERLAIEAAAIERAARQRGTPVLEVRYRRGGEPRIALFFFAPPPPLEKVRQPRPLALLGAGGLTRMAEMQRMRRANRARKPLIQVWESAIRAL